MRKTINKLISKIKGEKYIISDDIPLKYLISIIFRRLVMLIRGCLTICEKEGCFFRGSKVKMYCKSKIKMFLNSLEPLKANLIFPFWSSIIFRLLTAFLFTLPVGFPFFLKTISNLSLNSPTSDVNT